MQRLEIPRLDVPDAIFSWSVFSLSLRQFALILLAAIAALNFWTFLGVLGMSAVLEWFFLAFLLVVVVVFGWVKVKGRSFEYYLVVRLRYALRPHIAVWQQRESSRERRQP